MIDWTVTHRVSSVDPIEVWILGVLALFGRSTTLGGGVMAKISAATGPNTI